MPKETITTLPAGFHIGTSWMRKQIMEAIETMQPRRKYKFLSNIEKNTLENLLRKIERLPMEPPNAGI